MSASTPSIARLITSAAEPWMGEFNAWRSAFSRSTRLVEVRSENGRRRPKMVVV